MFERNPFNIEILENVMFYRGNNNKRFMVPRISDPKRPRGGHYKSIKKF